MDQVDSAGTLWGVITIAGPIILALAILFAMFRNRRTHAEKEMSERAVRDQHDADRKAEGLPPKTGPVSATKN